MATITRTITVTTEAQATAAALTGYGTVAGARADLLGFGCEKEAMRAAAIKAHSLAQALERGEHFTSERFELLARQIDDEMAWAGKDTRLPARADQWLALFNG
ncbi:hypothetical protein [Streptomyces mirabilis]|uniref:hypothetical protein n=1 Tax=Streptomyces mirabilis TaxID=68239 RepID=UPI002256B8FE|nr:hypothetical protein [Streptomyces mirabilis]MCX4609434.1 hypothetical protein [Streptomyces mirabilis]